jgi:hypothetical protein
VGQPPAAVQAHAGKLGLPTFPDFRVSRRLRNDWKILLSLAKIFEHLACPGKPFLDISGQKIIL